MKENIFGVILKQIRNSRGLGLRTFAKMLNVSPTYIHDLEYGNRLSTLEIINKLFSNLSLSNEEIKSIKLAYNKEHPTFSIPSKVIEYIIENDLSEILLLLSESDEKGINIKKLTKKAKNN